ncbi:hypothetical protein CGRA01v4_06260 [Colletotrichum graminicola]|nr:hypothetical protein CGRA01v4_06260 [Colletotrichum graminicola]
MDATRAPSCLREVVSHDPQWKEEEKKSVCTPDHPLPMLMTPGRQGITPVYPRLYSANCICSRPIHASQACSGIGDNLAGSILV